MPYRYLEDIAIADAAFEAWDENIEEMLVSAAKATLNIMVGDLSAIRLREYRHLQIEDQQLDMLLFRLLQELVYYKDAEQLLLLIQNVQVEEHEEGWTADVELSGEAIDPQRHDLIVDIKAITLHRLSVQKTSKGWSATVIVDV